MTTHRGHVVTPSPDRAPTITHAVLEVAADGRVAAVHPASSWRGPVDEDHGAALIFPGFVDVHVHWAQHGIVGAATGPLLDWLTRSTFPEEARFAARDHARAVARRFLIASAAAGTTTSLAYGPVFPEATGLLLEEAEASGARLVTGPVLMDDDCPPALHLAADRALPALDALVGQWHGRHGRLFLAAIPRFALSCTRAMMEGAAALARRHRLVATTHLAENPAEVAIAERRFGQRYLDVYATSGLLHERVIFAHCVHLSADDWDRFAAADAVVAHCPDSNRFLGSGDLAVAAARDRGIRVGLGSDVAGGRSLRVPRALSHAHDAALATGAPVAPGALLWWATRGGALGLGLDDVGLLSPGMRADFVVIDVPEWATTDEERVGWALFDGDAPPPRATFVDGKPIWRRPDGCGFPWEHVDPLPKRPSTT